MADAPGIPGAALAAPAGAALAAPAGAALAAPAGAALAAPAVLLVTEDDRDLRELTVEFLAEAGYEVIPAEDAEAALVVLRGARKVDLLITDVRMPGMDGLALARWTAENRPAVKIIIASGFAEALSDARHSHLRDVPVLDKPYLLADLLAQVAAKLAGPAA